MKLEKELMMIGKGEIFNISGAVRDISSVFPRCNIDAYYRKSGYERETKIYVGRRIGLFGYASKQIYYEFNGGKKSFQRLPWNILVAG